jgi:hypothetical protein
MNSVRYLIIGNKSLLILEDLEPYINYKDKIVECQGQIAVFTKRAGDTYSLRSFKSIENELLDTKESTWINKHIQKEKIKYYEYLLRRLTSHIRNQKIDNIIVNYEDTLILAC